MRADSLAHKSHRGRGLPSRPGTLAAGDVGLRYLHNYDILFLMLQ